MEMYARVFRPTTENGARLEISHDLKLLPGTNRLELIAANGKASSSAVGVDVQYTVAKPLATANAHVLVIGVSSYEQPSDGLKNLPLAALDAGAFVEAARAQQNGKLYREVKIRALIGSEATRTNILDGFQWLVDSVQPGDSAMIFFSGHAFIDSQDNFYLASHEVDLQRLRATAVAWRQFTSMLHEDLPRCKRVLFLDALPTEDGIKPGMRNPLLDLAVPELGTTFFASNTLQQRSAQAAQAEHGTFVQAIIDTLKDADADQMPTPPDQMLNSLELAKSIKTRVLKASAGRQVPISYATSSLRRGNVLQLLQTDGRGT